MRESRISGSGQGASGDRRLYSTPGGRKTAIPREHAGWVPWWASIRGESAAVVARFTMDPHSAAR